jgi:hypothetical protein
MARSYYGDQYDLYGSLNERNYRQNFADRSKTVGYPTAPERPLPYFRNNITFRASPGMSLNWYQHKSYGPYGVSAPSMSEVVDTASLQSLRNNCRTKAIANLNGNMRGSDFNLGVTMVEARETVSTIIDVGSRLIKAFRNVRRGKFSKAADYLFMDPPSRRQVKSMTSQMGRGHKGLANNWLKYRYGIRPMIGDVYNGIDAFNTIANFDDRDLIYRGFAAALMDVSSGKRRNIAKIHSNFDIYVKSVDRSTTAFAALGLDNPKLVGWELIPFSFVFDWFIPVGTYLEALKSPKGYSFSCGSEGSRTRHHAILTNGEAGEFTTGNTWSGWSISTPTSGEYYEDTYQRKLLSDLPVPHSLPSPKSLDRALGLSQALDLVSILTGFSSNRSK